MFTFGYLLDSIDDVISAMTSKTVGSEDNHTNKQWYTIKPYLPVIQKC